MKFMKLGSKPDCFQTDDKNTRYVATDLATDLVVDVAQVKFYLHKFPLLSKSARLQKLINGAQNDEVLHIHDIPGGSSSFEICAKFCYGMTINLNAYNVVSVRCAAEYLEMHEKIEKGNLVYKIDVFLNSTIFRSWKDSIIALHTTKSALPWSEELKLVTRCIDAVASKASVDVLRVDWSYGYDRKKILDENGSDESWPDGVRSRTVPNDWWVEDLCDLEVDLYKRVIVAIRNKGIVTNEVIGEALIAYAYRKLPGSKCVMKPNDSLKFGSILDAIVSLMPPEKGIVPCSFLLKLLKTAISVKSGETIKTELVKRIGQQLEEASVTDLLMIRASDEGATRFDVVIVQKMLQEFKTRYQNAEIDEISGSGILSEASELMVAKLIDGYLAEIAKDPDLPLSIFVATAEMVSAFPRPKNDGLYRAIDTYLKEHRGMSKSERKRVCGLMDCKKLSAEACRHAVQNERLPLRVVVQVLFLEQVRSSTSSGTTTPDLPKRIKDLSRGSSRSSGPTNADEDWDGVASGAELRALRAEVAALRLGINNGINVHDRNRQSNAVSKVKGLITSRKIFSRIWSSRGADGTDNTSRSDSSESLGSTNHDEAKCTPTRRGRHSVS